MDYLETLSFIHSLGNFSKPATLSRITSLLSKLGNPQDEIPVIHIAGTNGKGSVSAMLAGVFEAEGYKTGLFISPFIIDFRERIQINGRFISEAELVKCAETVKSAGVDVTEFEFITAAAFLYFRSMKCDIIIAETGLGGRLDATNAIRRPKLSVITKIGLDHTAILGETLEQIAAEKCGIIKDSPVVCAPFQAPAALGVITRAAKSLTVPDISQLEILKCGESGSSFIYKGRRYDISLCGEYQIENALTVIEAAEKSGCSIPYESVKDALANTFFPARAEIISKSPLVVLDGAHNPDGAAALAKLLVKYSGRATAIIGMMRDKDSRAALEATLPHCRAAVAVTVENMPRSLDAEALAGIAGEFCQCRAAHSYSDAIEAAVSLSQNEPIFVFGSLYLAAGIRTKLKERFGAKRPESCK